MTETTPRPLVHTVFDRDALPQYSKGQILGIWFAVTVPMAVLAWIVAPWLGDRIGGSAGFVDALVICFDAGLLWQVALVLILVRRERGSLAWSGVRDALWLRAPQDPKTGRVGGKVWWWVLVFVVISAAANALPIDPTGPLPRDLPKDLELHRLDQYFSGNWIGFAMIAFNALLAPIAEELVFRGLLLPRMRGAFGRGDFVASGILHTVYHLHQPWNMPATLLDSIFGQAYPTRRFRSTWLGLASHTAPSFVIIGVILTLVI
jgi:membrane protease YdiL (CAAX protease family)